MGLTTKISQALKRDWLLLLLWGIIFALAYAPSPLYTSNQNQYFLQGMARAGYGNLSDDWLANTQTPTPVFSWIVSAVYSLTHWDGLFYVLFALLAGVYIISLYAIGMRLFHFRGNWRWVFLTVLVAVNSATVRFIIVRVLGIDWVYLFDGGAAGQRILGEVLQPSAFGVLLLTSIACFLKQRTGWAVVFLVLASVVHPTYLLGAALLTLLYMALDYRQERNWLRTLMIGLVTLIAVLPIVINTYTTFRATDAETLAQAHEVLVTYRIPHHAIPAEWFNASDVFKLGLLFLALWSMYRRGQQSQRRAPGNLFHILLWPGIFVVLMTTVVAFTGNYQLALLFPWRVSVILVPLALTVLAGTGLRWLIDRFDLSDRIPGRVLFWGSLAFSLILGVLGLMKTGQDYRERVNAADRPMMAWVQANKQPGEIYVIPLKMQDFRLETGAAAYAEFKSIPYSDADVLEWYHRVLMASRWYRLSGDDVDCGHLLYLWMEARATHVVLPVNHQGASCDNLEELYRDENYGVYRYLLPNR